MRARPGSPADQRITIGLARRTPAGTSRRTPWLQKPRASAASLSSSGRPLPPSSSARRAVRVPGEGRAECLEHDAAGRDLGGEGEAADAVLVELDQSADTGRQLERTPGAGTFAVRMYGRTSASSAARRSR